MTIAYVREVPDAINECELTYLDRSPIDVAVAREQHAAYVEALRGLGVDVRFLPTAHDLADSVFVEDTALVLAEVAIITNPGADSRRRETESAERALAAHRPIARIEPPATIDGGDITVVGREIFVGLSTRSTTEAVEQLRSITRPLGYRVTAVEVRNVLHLKSAATAIGPTAVLLNPDYVERSPFEHLEVVETHPDEPDGANAVLLDGMLLYGEEFPKTREALVAAGYEVVVVPSSELAKAEGAVTCCSLLVRPTPIG